MSVRDFNSFGVVSRVVDVRTNRVRDLFSNGEYWFQEYASFDNRIVYAEEQWPILPMSETITLAAELGIDHPGASRGVNIEVRTDMLIGVRKAPRSPIEDIVVEVKDSPSHYEGPRGVRALEKRKLVEIWCNANEKRFLVLFKSDVPQSLLKNLRWLRYGQHKSSLRMSKSAMKKYADAFKAQWKKGPSASLDDIACAVAEKVGLTRDTSICVFQRCVWNRLLLIDLKGLVIPCNAIKLTEDPNMGVAYPW